MSEEIVYYTTQSLITVSAFITRIQLPWVPLKNQSNYWADTVGLKLNIAFRQTGEGNVKSPFLSILIGFLNLSRRQAGSGAYGSNSRPQHFGHVPV